MTDRRARLRVTPSALKSAKRARSTRFWAREIVCAANRQHPGKEGSRALLFLYATLELNNARVDQADGSIDSRTQVPHLFPQYPHLAQILSNASQGTWRACLYRHLQLLSDWAGCDPGVQFCFGSHDGATGSARRPSHRKTKLFFITLYGANALAQVVCNIFPTAENVCRNGRPGIHTHHQTRPY